MNLRFGRSGPCSPAHRATTASAPSGPTPGSATEERVSVGRSLTIRYVVLSGGNLLASAVGFLAAILVARQFGAAGLGATTLALALVGYALTITVFGTDLHAVRHVAARPESLTRMVAGVMTVRLIAGVAAYAALIAVVLFVPRFSDIAPLAASFGLSLVSSAIGPEWVPMATHRTEITALAKNHARSPASTEGVTPVHGT